MDALASHGSRVVERGDRQATAQCPAHEDRNPSLSVRGIEGQALVHCFAGCEVADVLAALGLAMRDLFDTRNGAEYRYDDGRIVHRSPDKRFRQSNVTTIPELYRRAAVEAAVAAGERVYLVEGEKDVHALESAGVVATTAPQGAQSIARADLSPLRGGNITVVVDADDAGAKWSQIVAEKLDGKVQSIRFVCAAAGKDAADHIAAGHGVDELEPYTVAEPAEDRAERARRTFPRIDWHELWADDEEEEWIHYPLIPARRSVVLYSPPKVGKSLLALELAVKVSRAEQYLGFQIERRFRVLYVDFENDPRGDIRTRLQDMGYVPADLDHLDYLSFPTMAGLDTERGAAELLEAVRAYGSEVVIIDTVSRAVVGEENSNDTWLGLYRNTGLQLKRAEVAVLRLDHTGKDESKGTRGGSAKSGDVDAIWKLSRITNDQYRLECTDSRLQVGTKFLKVTRQTSPRLAHTVAQLATVTDREARITHLIGLCDEAGLPADTGRDGVREHAKAHGVKARNDMYAEVVKRRKAAAGPVPEGWGQVVAEDLSPSVGTGGDGELPIPPLTSENTCPQPQGTTGDNPIGPPVPVPTTLGGDSGDSGTFDEICPTCAEPLNQTERTPISRCRADHRGGGQ